MSADYGSMTKTELIEELERRDLIDLAESEGMDAATDEGSCLCQNPYASAELADAWAFGYAVVRNGILQESVADAARDMVFEVQAGSPDGVLVTTDFNDMVNLLSALDDLAAFDQALEEVECCGEEEEETACC